MFHAGCALENGKFLAISGSMDDDDSMKCELYSIELDRWTALPDLTTSKYSHSMTSRADRYLYIFGGFDLLNDDKDLNSIECLDLNHL